MTERTVEAFDSACNGLTEATSDVGISALIVRPKSNCQAVARFPESRCAPYEPNPLPEIVCGGKCSSSLRQAELYALDPLSLVRSSYSLFEAHPTQGLGLHQVVVPRWSAQRRSEGPETCSSARGPR